MMNRMFLIAGLIALSVLRPLSAASVAVSADTLTISGCSANRATGNGAVGLHCTGSIHGSVNFLPSSDGNYKIGIAARNNSNFFQPFPQMRLSIDGLVIGTVAVTNSAFSTYTFNQVALNSGMHVIDIAFANGFSAPHTGFALFIKSFSITPTSSSPPPPPPPPGGPDVNQQQLLDLINGSRATIGLPPYKFSAVQSNGTSSCIGSLGHSEHMAQTGQLVHDQFPADLCLPFHTAGENICEWPATEAQAIINCHQAMMNEGPSGGHYQNIMNSNYQTVGLGLVFQNGTLWMTEDFIGQ